MYNILDVNRKSYLCRRYCFYFGKERQREREREGGREGERKKKGMFHSLGIFPKFSSPSFMLASSSDSPLIRSTGSSRSHTLPKKASLLAALSRIHGLGPLPRGRPSSQWTPLVKAHVTRGLGVTSSNKTASSLPSLGPQVMGPSSSTSLGWPGVSAADPLPPGSSGSLGIYSELSSDTVHYINPFN